MGLAERRATKEFQDNHFPAHKAAIDRAAGFEVELEVRWETLARDGMAHLYLESWPKLYFIPVERAFKDICRDELGRDALRAQLKKVRVQSTNGNFTADYWSHFENGVLTLEQELSNVDDVEARTKCLIATLERAL